MNIRYPLSVLIISTILVSGCATTPGGEPGITEEALCFMAMSAAGGGAGTAIDDDEIGFTAGGIVLGGILGYYLCDEGEEEPVVEETRVTDSDGDGVEDTVDSCPGTPRGTRVNSFGCPLDSDGDGVADNSDRCPNTPRGAEVDSTGCEVDSDRDGVVDSRDRCPDTPAGQSVNNVGCHIIFSLDSVEGVNFAFDSDALTPAAENRLDDAIDMLQENPEIVVRIEGHTDSLGSEAYNMGLSERRAAAVVEYLVANGITRDRLTSVGMGENAPTADNNTEEGRARNRRVDFVIRNQ